jgi:hypothetical protein
MVTVSHRQRTLPLIIAALASLLAFVALFDGSKETAEKQEDTPRPTVVLKDAEMQVRYLYP